jgi:hypothetical protein
MRILLLIIAFLLLLGTEVLKVYFIMPFPGSQVDETLSIAYFLNEYIIYFRIITWAFFLFNLFQVWGQTATSGKVIIGILISFYLFIFILFNYYFVADQIFFQPEHKLFATASNNKIDTTQLVIGVAIGNEAKAYPLEIIGYHHQVRDTVGGKPVMITYCTVCRTGRVYSPFVNNQPEEFRLVGMDHFNAMFEDSRTKSWWRQVNGEAVAGPLTGSQLEELPSTQVSLRNWLAQYPDSKIMQPDTVFKLGYEDLKLYDEGKVDNELEKRDSLSWKNKSWVVGVQLGNQSRAYDWIELVNKRVINDTLNGIPIAVVVENDSASFHVFKRDSLQFMATGSLSDLNTKSTWKWNGKCTSGVLEGQALAPVQSYQEFWHSWKTFHPKTTIYQLAAEKK